MTRDMAVWSMTGFNRTQLTMSTGNAYASSDITCATPHSVNVAFGLQSTNTTDQVVSCPENHVMRDWRIERFGDGNVNVALTGALNCVRPCRQRRAIAPISLVTVADDVHTFQCDRATSGTFITAVNFNGMQILPANVTCCQLSG